ncbi:11281_t:CDS:2, partial [Scutellospora calospora]
MECSMSLYEEPLLDRDFNMSSCELSDENVIAETSFLNSLDRLTVDILHVLCKAEGLPSIGNKKEIAERLAAKTASKLKGKDSVVRNQLDQASECVNYIEDRSKAEVHRKEAGNNVEQVESNYDEGSNKRFHEPLSVFLNQNEDNRLGEERRYLILEKFLEKSLQAILAKALVEMKQSLYVIGNKVEENKFWPESWDIAAALDNSISEDSIEAALREKLIV